MFAMDYCGYQIRNKDCDLIYRPSGSVSHLFLLILSPMMIEYPDGTREKVRPGGCMLYTAGYYQRYYAEKEFYNSYVHFYCEQEELDRFSLIQNRVFYPDNTEEINWFIKKLYQEFLNKLPESEKMMELYLQQLMILLSRELSHQHITVDNYHDVYQEFNALRRQMLARCSEPWTIPQLCSMLNVSKSQLYKFYDMFFMNSPKEELIQARLQKVKYLLTNEAMTIQEAALESGFSNINHFNRLFHRECGCTPGEYRKRNRLPQRKEDKPRVEEEALRLSPD